MSLQSLGFWLFLPITALIDLHLPVKWQNPFLAAASLYFIFTTFRPIQPGRLLHWRRWPGCACLYTPWPLPLAAPKKHQPAKSD